MDVKILNQKENKLLHRKELQVRVESESTAKRDDLVGKLAELLNVDKNVVVVDSIYQSFGSHKANSYVKVYESAEHLQKTEPKKKEKKGKEGAAPAATPAPAEKKEAPKSEEKKPEAKKEEKPAEAKKEEKK